MSWSEVPMSYRVYLYNSSNKICAADHFVAEDVLEALEIGAVLARATQDVFHRHEVWCGTRHVTGAGGIGNVRTVGMPTLATLPEMRQMRAVDLEQRLAESFACVRR